MSIRRPNQSIAETTGLIHKGGLERFTFEMQIELKSRCDTQKWVGVCDATFHIFGRGLVSTQLIQKDEIICDYHGKCVTSVTYDEYIEDESVNPEFVMQIIGPPRRLIDATDEICPLHPENRCLGRLANHVTQRKHNFAANMKAVEIFCDLLQPTIRICVLKARRTIEPFEQLRFDYGDRVAHQMFQE